jgi:hypothetical protein
MSLGLVILHFALYGCIDDWNLTFYCESLPFMCVVLVAVEVSDWRQLEIWVGLDVDGKVWEIIISLCVFCCLWDFRVDVVFIVCTWVRKCCCCCCRSCLLGRLVFRWDYGVIAKLADEREGYGKSLRVWCWGWVALFRQVRMGYVCVHVCVVALSSVVAV